MRKNCKSCGAPLSDRKCDYCGTTNNYRGKNSKQSTDTLSYDNSQDNDAHHYEIPQNDIPQDDIPENIEPDIDERIPSQDKLAINNVAGIFAIINAMLLTFYNLFLYGNIANSSMTTDTEYLILGFALFAVIILMVIALVLHIVGLVRSKRNGIPIAGHVLGLIGVAVTLLTITLFSIISIILFFIAAFLILTRKNTV